MRLCLAAAALCVYGFPSLANTIWSTCSAHGVDLYGQAWEQVGTCGGEFAGYVFSADSHGVQMNVSEPPGVDTTALWNANGSYLYAEATSHAGGTRTITPESTGTMEYRLRAQFEMNSHRLEDGDEFVLGAPGNVSFVADGTPLPLTLVDNYGPVTGGEWAEVWIYAVSVPVAAGVTTTHTWDWEQFAALRMNTLGDKYLRFDPVFVLGGEPLFTPVPEPGGLVSLGLITLMAWRRLVRER